MVEVKELVEAIETLGGEAPIGLICNFLAMIKKMPFELEHRAQIIKILEENPDQFILDNETNKWMLKTNDDKINSLKPKNTNLHITLSDDIEKVLFNLNAEVNKIFEGTKYSSIRNSTITMKNIDLFYEGIEGRIGFLYPKEKGAKTSFCLTKELMDKLGSYVKLEGVEPVKKTSNYRRIMNVPMQRAYELLEIMKEKVEP